MKTLTVLVSCLSFEINAISNNTQDKICQENQSNH